ncbi:MAG: DegV family protein [Dehalococcoidia bacterium]
MTVRVVTDSTADLSPELCHKLGITVVPLTVHFGEQTYRDGVDLSSQEFFAKLQSSSQLPKTSQPPAGAFAEAYSALADEAEQVLSIHVSSRLSQTCNSAQLGAREVEGRCRVEVVDSLQVSLGLGLIVMAAARAVRDGASLEEARDIARRAASNTRTVCLLDTLEYLAKGGRIGKLQFWLGSTLRPLAVFKVIPMLLIKDGEAHPLDRVRTRRRGLERLAREVLEAQGLTDVGVVYSTTPDEARELSRRIGERVPQERLHTAQFGPVLGTYVGPGAIGIAMTQA